MKNRAQKTIQAFTVIFMIVITVSFGCCFPEISHAFQPAPAQNGPELLTYNKYEDEQFISEKEYVQKQNPDRYWRNFDHVINNRRDSRITLATGIPFIAIGEFAYGITDRTTIGVMAGLTPAVEGYGIRVRHVIYQPIENYRIYFCTPVIYYPTLSGGDPWWLTRPNINFEWLTKSNFRYKAGGSIIAATSNNHLFGDGSKATMSPDFWTSIHGGISVPLKGNISFQAEVSYVSKGIQPVKEFVGAPPVILVLGASYIF